MTAWRRLASFARSPHHAWLGLLTLGVGLATANVPGMIAAAAAYALGWIFLPDSGWFRRWREGRDEAANGAASAESAAEFGRRRADVYRQLHREAKSAYDQLAEAVEEIRSGSGEAAATHAGRLGQLAWTYLRLLLTRQTLADFCSGESSPRIAEEIAEIEAEVAEVEARALAAGEAGDASEAGALERLLQSKRSRHESLLRHRDQVKKAENDLILTDAEIERIFDAVRLVRADLVTRRDPDVMGTEIDRATAHFHRTRDWLRDLEFDQTPSDIPDEVTASVPLRLDE